MKTLQAIIDEANKEFEDTKFAKGGGSSFECSDYEGMYDDLKSFLTQQITIAVEEALESVVPEEREVKLRQNCIECSQIDSPFFDSPFCRHAQGFNDSRTEVLDRIKQFTNKK